MFYVTVPRYNKSPIVDKTIFYLVFFHRKGFNIKELTNQWSGLFKPK